MNVKKAFGFAAGAVGLTVSGLSGYEIVDALHDTFADGQAFSFSPEEVAPGEETPEENRDRRITALVGFGAGLAVSAAGVKLAMDESRNEAEPEVLVDFNIDSSEQTQAA